MKDEHKHSTVEEFFQLLPDKLDPEAAEEWTRCINSI
jgi:hypothetical protein